MHAVIDCLVVHQQLKQKIAYQSIIFFKMLMGACPQTPSKLRFQLESYNITLHALYKITSSLSSCFLYTFLKIVIGNFNEWPKEHRHPVEK